MENCVKNYLTSKCLFINKNNLLWNKVTKSINKNGKQRISVLLQV